MNIFSRIHWGPWNSIQKIQFRNRSCGAPLKWSYLAGPGNVPLLGLTMGQVTQRAADLFGDNEAVVSCEQNIRKTYCQINRESEQLAAGLSALGLKHGDRLGIWGPNSYEWYLTQHAAGKAGIIMVNINPSYRANELKYCLNKVSVKGIVCADSFKTSNYYAMIEEIFPEISNSESEQLDSKDLPFLKTIIMMVKNKRKGTFTLDEVLDAAGSDDFKDIQELENKIQFDEPCNIQFTSGTTGLPKGAILSHHNVLNNAYFVGHRLQYQKMPKICIPVPLYHCFGCVVGTLASTLFGCTLLLPSAGFDPKAIIECFKKEEPNICYGTPTMFVDILKEFRKSPFDLRCMSSGIMSGAPCPQELVTAVIQELNMKDFITLYGTTETSPVTFQCYPTDDPKVRSTTVGYPVNHTEVKIVDSEGLVTPIGVPGELYIRGYCNFLGYWEDKEKTEESFTLDRWFKTGDLASINEDGYGAITGRIKDVIIRGGENIYPAEIENFFMSHSLVVEAQVFGVPDSRMGEEVVMWIHCNDDANLSVDSLKNWCKGKIAHYKVPKHIMFKDKFPTTVTGKVQKFMMKEQTILELGL